MTGSIVEWIALEMRVNGVANADNVITQDKLICFGKIVETNGCIDGFHFYERLQLSLAKYSYLFLRT